MRMHIFFYLYMNKDKLEISKLFISIASSLKTALSNWYCTLRSRIGETSSFCIIIAPSTLSVVKSEIANRNGIIGICKDSSHASTAPVILSDTGNTFPAWLQKTTRRPGSVLRLKSNPLASGNNFWPWGPFFGRLLQACQTLRQISERSEIPTFG